MTRNTDISPALRDSPASRSCAVHGTDSLQALKGRLRNLGFTGPELFGPGRNVAGGVPLEIPVRKLLGSPAGMPGTVRSLLRDRVAVTFSLTDLGGGDTAIDALQGFCNRLRDTLQTCDNRGTNVGTCMYARQAPLAAYRSATACLPGPRYVLLDRAYLAHHGIRHFATEDDWQLLWRHRGGPAPLLPAYGATIRPGCRLLDDEAATSVLPVHGIQVPAGSAWLPVSLHAPGLADDRGDLQWDRVSDTLASGLEVAEDIMSRLHWPHPGQAADATANRRLALSLTGLGDLVARRGLDPRRLETLEWLTAFVRRIRDMLWANSARMARENGILPALRRGDPSDRWDDGDHREHWKLRWQEALEQSAVRHRNMFVVSPYALLPSDGSPAFAYTDLLPVIAFADAWSFAADSCRGDFDQHEFTTFHRRAWAVIRGRRAGSLVAAGP